MEKKETRGKQTKKHFALLSYEASFKKKKKLKNCRVHLINLCFVREAKKIAIFRKEKNEYTFISANWHTQPTWKEFKKNRYKNVPEKCMYFIYIFY